MVNYKHRWFELSRIFIIYYDNCEGGKEVSLIFIFLSFHVCFTFIYFPCDEVGSGRQISRAIQLHPSVHTLLEKIIIFYIF